MADTIEETTEAVETNEAVETVDAPEDSFAAAETFTEDHSTAPVDDGGGGDQVQEDSGAVEPSEPSETETPDLSTDLIERAKEFNMTEETARSLGADVLNGMFAGIDRRIGTPQPQQQQVQQPVQTQQAPMPTEYQPLKIEFGEDVDESLTAPFNSFMEQVNQRLADAHNYRQESENRRNVQTTQGHMSEMDSYLKTLGGEWNAEYGDKATLDHKDVNDPHCQKRLELFRVAAAAYNEAATHGRAISKSESFKRAHHSIHWDKIAEKTRDELNGKVTKRQNSFGNRSTGKGNSPPQKLTVMEKALAAAGA